MKKPLVGICIFLCLGIWLAKYIPIPQYILFISAFILPILTFIMLRHNRRISTAFLWLCFFVLGAFLLKNAEMLPSNHINRYISNKGKAAYLKGIVDNDPVEKRLRYGNRTTCILNAYKLGINNREYDVCGKVLVNIYRSENLEYGNEVLLKGKIYKPMRFQISDRLNYRDYLKQKNIYGIFSVKKDIPVTILGQRIENPLKTFAFKLKRKVKNIFVGHLPFLEAAFMKAMFLGERQDIPQFLKDVFARTGTVHILAISGLHVGIIIFIILFFLKAVRIPRKTRFVITMMFLIVYVFITGARPSVIRAAVMAMVLLGGYLFEREIDVYNSLAAAALMILLYNPKQLFDIGFQLSFLSVISIIYLYPRFEKKMIKREFPGIVKFFMKCFCVSSAAWCCWFDCLLF